jgi:hypothetical protein
MFFLAMSFHAMPVGSLVVIDVNHGKDMQENTSKAQEG